jgi:hypothetical protein
MGRSRRDDIRHAARESLGLCHLLKGWPSSAATQPAASALQRGGRPLDVEPPLRRTTGGKKAGASTKRATARGSVRGSHDSRSRGRCRSVASRWSHTHRSAVLLGSRVLPRPERQHSGICTKRELRFGCPESRAGEGRRGTSMKGILDRGSRAEPSREARPKWSWFANADVKNRCSRDDGISEEPLSQRLVRRTTGGRRERAHRSGSLVVNRGFLWPCRRRDGNARRGCSSLKIES